MAGESIISIELAVASAVVVLSARLFAIIQATRGVPDAHRQVLEAVSSGDFGRLKSKARGLGYRNPYGEVASDLIEASEKGALQPDKRADFIDRAAKIAQRRLARKAQQGQAADLFAFTVAFGLMAFSRETLPTGPLFWSLGGAILILLLSSMVARGSLRASISSSLEALHATLVARPQFSSISDGPVDCFWCGETTAHSTYELRCIDSDDIKEVEAAVCANCGKFVANLPLGDSDEEPSST